MPKTKRSSITRSGTRRLGDEYQDLVALELLIDWLEHSDRYEWIEVEADEVGALDDVVALRSDGVMIYRQVKFAVHSNNLQDLWTWDRLLAQEAGKKHSFLQAWASSLKKTIQSNVPIDAALYSNRDAAPEVAQAFQKNGSSRIDFTRIPPATREKIVEQLDGEEQAQRFFQQFGFDINKPNLPELEERLKRRFTVLGGSNEGWLSLKEAVGTWVCNRELPPPDGRIRLIDIQQAALWHSVEGLAQNYSIPDDYVPLENFIEDFKQQILPNHSGTVVVTGNPGIGKSTFMSYLYSFFLEEKIPVIRHHYYLGSQDPTPGFRLDYLHTAQSLMHDLLYEHSQAIGNFRGENPRPEHLRKWITACGEYYAKHNRTFYILLDGLDHVWRETGTVTELTQLLDQLFPLPSGIAIIFATQPVDERYLPRVFLRHTPPRDKWVQVPRLDLPAVIKWVGKRVKGFPTQEELFRSPILIERLAQALYQKGQGHPLHLHYTLKTIQERNLAFTEETIATLPGCPHEGIIAYYKELWHGLSEGSQEIMYLFAATQFPWQRYDLAVCLDSEEQQHAKIYEDLRQVIHLLTSGDLGLQPFHSSIISFIVQNEEYSDYKMVLLQKTLFWLQQKAPSYWTWAYLWLIEAQIGNDTALYREPSRVWALNAIVAGRPYRHTLRLLRLSLECALKHGDLPRVIEVGLLHSYFYEIHPSHLDICERIRYPQLKLMEDTHLQASLLHNLEDLTDNELVLLAEDAFTREDQKTFNRCRRVVERRARYGQQHLSGGSYPSWQQHITPQLALVAMRNEASIINQVTQFIAANRDQGRSQEIAYLYGEHLYRYRNIEHLRKLLSFLRDIDEKEPSQRQALTREEISLLQRYVILLALEEDLEVDDVLLSEIEPDPLVALYAAIRSTPGYRPAVFDLPDHQLFNLKWHEAYEQKFELREAFYRAFFAFLANHLYSRGDVNGVWLQAPRTLIWVQHILQALNAYAVIVADNIHAATPIIFGNLFTKLSNIPLPKLNEDRVGYEYYKSVCEATVNIELDLAILSNAISGKSFINQAALQQALSSEYCDLDVFLQKIAIRQRRILERPAVQWLMSEQMTVAQTLIVPCAERAERFARLGECAALHEEWSMARQNIRVSADHMLAHGYHKDMLFYNTLGAVQRYAKNIPPEIFHAPLMVSWIKQLAPAVAAITNYTDGDETRHFPMEIAEVLGLVAPEKLYDYYEWQCAQGDHHQALSTLHVFLEKADLTQPVAQALALTAIDQQSLHLLTQRAAHGDEGARIVLTQQHAYLGSITSDSNTTKSPQLELDTNKVNAFDPEQYPPDKFIDYINECTGYIPKQNIESWVEFWVTKKKKAEVCQALMDADTRGIDIGCYDQLFNMMRALYGKDKAYPWLVKASIMDFGWNWHLSEQERAERRWQIIKAQYPTRWQEFLKDTLLQAPVWSSTSLSHYDFRRLIEYHIFMGQYEQARNLVEEMVIRSWELVSMLPLSTPEWVDVS